MVRASCARTPCTISASNADAANSLIFTCAPFVVGQQEISPSSQAGFSSQYHVAVQGFAGAFGSCMRTNSQRGALADEILRQTFEHDSFILLSRQPLEVQEVSHRWWS